LTPADYRLWRDIGLRGYGADGLPRGGFRGRWEGRNAAFADLMVRTGMRLEEQSSLTVFEVPVHPSPRGTGFQRFWLPESIAKGASARWVYVPVPLVRELAAYSEFDRPEAIDYARSRGIYDRIRRPLIIEDPDRPEVLVPGQHGTRHLTKLAQLTPAERRRVLIDGPDGLEPAAFWLSEQGRPVALSTWKGLFADGNRRCAEQGSDLRCHPHMLRHTFAVVTLEQLQRGHIQNLADLNPEQRTHYTRVFGDPADWVRRRLGHASQTTTLKYWNYLAELEMTTRMELVPDAWDDPRLTPLSVIGDDHSEKAEDVVGAGR
jgi:integrase